MRGTLRFALCVALLAGCAAPYPATAQDTEVADCLKADQTFERVFTECLAAAESGDAKAQFILAVLYYKGHGVAQDYAEALVWCRRAAEQGLAKAQFAVAVMYYDGLGVPQNYAEALVWYRRAAEQGLALAQAVVGLMYYGGQGVQQDYVLAHMWLNLAGAGGRERAGELRDSIARHMTPAQIADAQRMAREWMEAHRAE